MSGHNITTAQAKQLYRTMKDVHDILLENNIPYWVTGGSLIGALRHRGIVPWDDDGDICIMKKDVNKLRKIVPIFEKNGYFIEEGEKDEEDDEDSDDDTKQCRSKKNTCTWFLEPKNKHALGVDIFVMERVGPLLTYADPYWRSAKNGGETCFFLYKFMFPLVPVRFGNFWVMTPFNAVEHLNQCYGPDWNSMSQRLFDHREGKWIDSKKIRMSVDDYGTIAPPKDTCEKTPPSMDKCTFRAYPSKKVKNLTKKELKMIAKIYKIKGRSKLSDTQLRAKIATIV